MTPTCANCITRQLRIGVYTRLFGLRVARYLVLIVGFENVDSLINYQPCGTVGRAENDERLHVALK